MNKVAVTVYDLDLKKVAYLENATTIGYDQPLNGLHTAQFTMPANDPKNAECLPMRFVELCENGERLDLYRIMSITTSKFGDGEKITYQCEHVLGTLLDDVLFQFHTIGGLGVYTDEVLEYLLSKQTVKRWKLGTVSFARQFEYNWENENLLNAIRSVPGPFVEEYMWTWDTSTYPWTLNLVEPPSEVDAYIRYGLNLQGIERQIDPRTLCTRLYGFGYGEGVNQLNFADINGGKPYLDADTQAQFGIISDIFVDRRFEHPETLKARCEAILNERKMPRITYTVQAADISQLTETPIHKFKSGGKVRVIDEDLGIDVVSRVVNVRKRDMRGMPGEVELEISNKPDDIATLFNELETKQRINDLYAQGATNWDTHDFSDNCDPTHPAVIRFWIPDEAVRINKVLLTYRTEPFRSYSRSVASSPSITSGPSSKTTTAGGGGVINTETGEEIWKLKGVYGIDVATPTGGHNHGIPPGTQLMVSGGGTVTWIAQGNHTHGLEGHYHEFTLPDHAHNMEHTHIIPPHSHGLEHGIFEGPTPTAVTVKVDGQAVPGLGTNVQDFDIIPYLSKDSEGKVQRGTWHTIEITPNSLGRIVAAINTQLFVNSRGGGSY